MARSTNKPPPLDASMRIAVLHGKESFLIAERTRRFADVLSESFGKIDRFDYDGAKVELAMLLDELRSYALMQQHKLVVLDNAEQFLARDKGAIRSAMERYAKSPVPDATLLMRAGTWRGGNIDKLIKKIGAVVKCEHPNDAKAVEWCLARCTKRYDATLADDAASLMVLRIGANLSRLDPELARLASFVGPGEVISVEVVRDQVVPSREEMVWELSNAIMTGSAETAVGMVRHQLALTSNASDVVIPMTWAVCDLVRKLHAAAQLQRQGVADTIITKQLNLWGGSGGPILRAARKGKSHKYAQLLQQAINADAANKSGLGNPVRNLEAMTICLTDSIS